MKKFFLLIVILMSVLLAACTDDSADPFMGVISTLNNTPEQTNAPENIWNDDYPAFEYEEDMPSENNWDDDYPVVEYEEDKIPETYWGDTVVITGKNGPYVVLRTDEYYFAILKVYDESNRRLQIDCDIENTSSSNTIYRFEISDEMFNGASEEHDVKLIENSGIGTTLRKTVDVSGGEVAGYNIRVTPSDGRFPEAITKIEFTISVYDRSRPDSALESVPVVIYPMGKAAAGE